MRKTVTCINTGGSNFEILENRFFIVSVFNFLLVLKLFQRSSEVPCKRINLPVDVTNFYFYYLTFLLNNS